MPVLEGTSLDRVPSAIAEFIRPGGKVDLIIGVDGEVSATQLAALQAQMASGGLPMRAEMGSTAEWPNAIRLRFRRPQKTTGVALLPLAVLLIGAIGAVGITGVLGWRLGTAVTDISKRIVPLAIIAGVAIVAMAYFKSRGEAR